MARHFERSREICSNSPAKRFLMCKGHVLLEPLKILIHTWSHTISEFHRDCSNSLAAPAGWVHVTNARGFSGGDHPVGATPCGCPGRTHRPAPTRGCDSFSTHSIGWQTSPGQGWLFLFFTYRD